MNASERLVLQVTPGIAACSYLDAPTDQFGAVTAPLLVQHVPSGLWLFPLLLILLAIAVTASVFPPTVLLGVFE